MFTSTAPRGVEPRIWESKSHVLTATLQGQRQGILRDRRSSTSMIHRESIIFVAATGASQSPEYARYYSVRQSTALSDVGHLPPCFLSSPVSNGNAWTRTRSLTVIGRVLYQLSYAPLMILLTYDNVMVCGIEPPSPGLNTQVL